MRYGEQVFEIDVPLNDVDWQAADLLDQIEQRFHRRHKELYTYASPGQEVVFVNARVAAIGQISKRAGDARATLPTNACSPHSTRRAFFGTLRDIPVYSFDALMSGHSLTGPAIIEAETTTVLIDTGDRVSVNALGWLDITLRREQAS
jgi:N-methylhydantoinase A